MNHSPLDLEDAERAQERKKAQAYNALVDSGINDPELLESVAGFTPLIPRQNIPGAPKEPPSTAPSSTPAPNPQAVPSGGGFFFEEDDDFKSQVPISQLEPVDAAAMDQQMPLLLENENIPEMPRKLSVPKIFIGTRTHKQVEQIVKELRRTAYSSVKMVVLSSREHSCIHPIVSNSFNKNEKCRELTDVHKGVLCSYYHGVNRIKNHEFLAINGGLEGAWDIEDLLRVGHKVNACPYFAARSLMASAELVICPYNYLVDPLIRQSMNISLKNHVLILDEAHNIEDSARSAASCSVTQTEMKETCSHLREWKSHEKECDKLANMISALSGWIDENNHNLSDYTEYGRSGKIYTGTEIIAVLDHLGIGRQNYSELENCFTTLYDKQLSEEGEMSLNAVTKKVLQDIFLVLSFLFMDNMKHKDDYRVAIVKEQVRKKSGQGDGWYSRNSFLELEYSIKFWCLNPAVVFSPLSNVTHSIILTSGTLSPITSFQSELGVSFKIQLEANHVIDQNQVFVGTVGHGPRGKPLQATFQHTESWEFQDELGDLVLNVCQTVPAGILCFLPSYSMLNKLHDRWQNTGVWDDISKIKKAMTEQKKGEDFERDMINFYTTIRNAQTERESNINGVFFMAVYRGKVSEGLDFTDDNARAVIAVGIPFPNIKDIQVDLKKKYNNTFHRSRKLLSGSEWYEIQAYRALNQALGRCIRHRYDWGALLLVDLRFQGRCYSKTHQENHYTRGLSKWVRNKIVHYQNFSTATNSLSAFVKNMMTNPPQPPNRHDEISASSFESMGEEKVQSSLTREMFLDKCPMKSSQNVNTCDELKDNNCHDQKECNAAVNRKKTQSSQEKSAQRCESDSCESSKENEKIFSQSRKRPLMAMDYEDLDDFNLTLSPSTHQAHQPPPQMRKRVGQKKGVIFSDIE
ncbi:Fanconi anemia group J protein homolog [Scylla paramamosain]|uniref:Fanconi anemia group J protein homolog n=1 Tax=Scylla paramamosain TaxID=85552 RepID=UPI00308298B4